MVKTVPPSSGPLEGLIMNISGPGQTWELLEELPKLAPGQAPLEVQPFPHQVHPWDFLRLMQSVQSWEPL